MNDNDRFIGRSRLLNGRLISHVGNGERIDIEM